ACCPILSITVWRGERGCDGVELCTALGVQEPRLARLASDGLAENVFGPNDVVFATDYLYGRNKGEYCLESRRRFVDEAKRGDEARQEIYQGNARQLLHLV